jgi:hypothetical protein
MTLAQIQELIGILQDKVEEGINLLENTPVNSTEFNTTLNNVISATAISAKFNIELNKLTEEKGEA